MKITIHHIREAGVKADLHLYCGRSYIPQGYPHLIHASMGNPFHMNGEADRNRVCDAYEEWIASPNAASHKRIIERMIQRVQEGKSIALYCHCAPKRCHCETIRELALNP